MIFRRRALLGTGLKKSPEGVVTNGLRLYLNSGDPLSYSGTGSDWYDLTTPQYNASLINNPTYSTDYGGLIKFNGIDQYGAIAGAFVLDDSNPFTIVTVVNSEQSQPYGHIASIGV